jgi:hypothetical protein
VFLDISRFPASRPAGHMKPEICSVRSEVPSIWRTAVRTDWFPTIGFRTSLAHLIRRSCSRTSRPYGGPAACRADGDRPAVEGSAAQTKKRTAVRNTGAGQRKRYRGRGSRRLTKHEWTAPRVNPTPAGAASQSPLTLAAKSIEEIGDHRPRSQGQDRLRSHFRRGIARSI